MRKYLVVFAAAVAVILAAGPAAYAHLVVDTNTTDITAFGFGVVNPTLTLQGTGSSVIEQGCSTVPIVSGQGTPCATTKPAPFNTLPEIGSTIGEDSKNTIVTLADANILTAADFPNLGLLFNVNESGNTTGQMITLQALTLGVFNGNALVGTFDLPAPVDLIQAKQQGQGAAGFQVSITAAESAAFLAAHGFSNTWTIGLYSQIGCLTSNGACDVAGNFSVNDGAESFTVANLVNPIPEPSTLLLLGGGLLGLGIWRFRKV